MVSTCRSPRSESSKKAKNVTNHWTDFSATRKSPLDREVRLAPNEKEAMKIADDMVTENIKKGWNEVAK